MNFHAVLVSCVDCHVLSELSAQAAHDLLQKVLYFRRRVRSLIGLLLLLLLGLRSWLARHWRRPLDQMQRLAIDIKFREQTVILEFSSLKDQSLTLDRYVERVGYLFFELFDRIAVWHRVGSVLAIDRLHVDVKHVGDEMEG